MERLTKREQPDRSKISQPDELKGWARVLDVTREQLLAAADKVGDSVRQEFERMAARQQASKRDQEFIEKSAECAREARHQAALLPDGPIRDALLKRAREYETKVPEDKLYK